MARWGLVVERAEPVVVAAAALRVKPALNPFEHRSGEVIAGVPVVLFEQIAEGRADVGKHTPGPVRPGLATRRTKGL